MTFNLEHYVYKLYEGNVLSQFYFLELENLLFAWIVPENVNHRSLSRVLSTMNQSVNSHGNLLTVLTGGKLYSDWRWILFIQ